MKYRLFSFIKVQVKDINNLKVYYMLYNMSFLLWNSFFYIIYIVQNFLFFKYVVGVLYCIKL